MVRVLDHLTSSWQSEATLWWEVAFWPLVAYSEVVDLLVKFNKFGITKGIWLM